MPDQTKCPDPQAGDGIVARDPTGLLIIRAWIEPGSSEPLRAHIRVSADVSAGIERTVTLSRPADVGAIVQEWLDDVMRHNREPVACDQRGAPRLGSCSWIEAER